MLTVVVSIAFLVVPSVLVARPSAASSTAAPAAIATAIPPSPCPSATATAAGSEVTTAASPGPCPTAPQLKTIAKVAVAGRKADLVGIASAASEGTIGPAEIANRPISRPGEVLEAIPGLVITQHSGEGKANQYYLRGFQLDHGTDLEATIGGIPINMVSHAHGQGYSDINWLMPELVSYVEFKKGTYYADQGDFSTAGAYNLYFRDTIAPVTSFGVGDYGYERFFTAASPNVGSGHLLYGIELDHDNGTFAKPDEYHKINGMARYTFGKGNDTYGINAFAYNGAFNSTDQIPQRLVTADVIPYNGYVDPTDGGNTYRYALSAQWQHQDSNGTTKLNVYGERYFLDLFSDFTYDFFDGNNYYNEVSNPITCNVAFNTCAPNAPGITRVPNYHSYCPAYTAPAGAAAGSLTPVAYNFQCGDQREQNDIRFISGGNFSRTFVTPGTVTTLGLDTRNDNISTLGLYLVQARNRLAGGTLSNDHVVERGSDIYIQSELRVGKKLRLDPGVRLDYYTYSDAAFDPNNNGKGSAAIVNPKMNLAYAPNDRSEFYLDYGSSFHSNDVRGTTYVDDPQTHDTIDSTGAPVGRNPLLNRSVGEEVGYRYTIPQFTTTVSLFELYQANELIFDGDHGVTSLGGPSQRRGIELANFFTPTKNLTLDADLATTTARFLDDPEHQGTGVPESLNGVVSLGATADTKTCSAALRMRYFGPRTLDTQGDAKSPSSTLWNAQYTAKLSRNRRLSIDFFNIFNANVPDVTYYYNSWLPFDAKTPSNVSNPAINPALGGGGVNDYHLHPAERRAARLTYALLL
jgi:TonB dependent receptor/TonB-dependent Receptor Plug Domain